MEEGGAGDEGADDPGGQAEEVVLDGEGQQTSEMWGLVGLYLTSSELGR